jgi:hypothetical protein
MEAFSLICLSRDIGEVYQEIHPELPEIIATS